MFAKVFTAAALVAALPLASAFEAFGATGVEGVATGHATIKNKCVGKVCVFQTKNGVITKTTKLAQGDSVKVSYPSDGATGAQTQISPDCTPGNVVYFEYSVGNGIVFYDVNTNKPSDPFADGLSVVGNDASCPKISCKAGGSLACFNNPNGHPQNQVKACGANHSLTLNTCST